MSGFHKLGLTISLFLTVMNYAFIFSAMNKIMISSNVAFSFMGLLIALTGNYMNNLKPNYIAGIRLPWTLNDADNWRQTHQLAGKIWFAGGITLILSGLLLPKILLMPFLVTILVALVIIPSVYSYKIYRRKLNKTL